MVTVGTTDEFLSSQYHPDKHSEGLSDAEKAVSVERFHEIAKAYEVLSDSKLKHDYDNNFNGNQ